MNLNKYYDYLVDYEIATDKEIDLVTDINGWDEETFDDILYCRTGYRDLEQYLEYEDKENFERIDDFKE